MHFPAGASGLSTGPSAPDALPLQTTCCNGPPVPAYNHQRTWSPPSPAPSSRRPGNLVLALTSLTQRLLPHGVGGSFHSSRPRGCGRLLLSQAEANICPTNISGPHLSRHCLTQTPKGCRLTRKEPREEPAQTQGPGPPTGRQLGPKRSGYLQFGHHKRRTRSLDPVPPQMLLTWAQAHLTQPQGATPPGL